MSKIADLLAELSRNDDCQPYYNDVMVKESEIVYQKRIEKLYNDAIDELFSISVDKNLVMKRLKEVEENQSYFLYYSMEEIQNRRDEENRSKSISMKQETDFLVFMSRCVDIQRFYLNRFKEYFYRGVELEPEQKPKPKSEPVPESIIKGVRGLAEHLGCGATKAQDILNKGILQKAGVAIRAGKGWRFNKAKLEEFVRNNPTAFRW